MKSVDGPDVIVKAVKEATNSAVKENKNLDKFSTDKAKLAYVFTQGFVKFSIVLTLALTLPQQAFSIINRLLGMIP
jgi:hypothetical protein